MSLHVAVCTLSAASAPCSPGALLAALRQCAPAKTILELTTPAYADAAVRTGPPPAATEHVADHSRACWLDSGGGSSAPPSSVFDTSTGTC